uniref:Vacuolar H+-pyrophosphatase n=1 Tax=Rhizophora mucronata TaxID=61149 RepID=A0A2P2K6F0_RHIMU
MILDTRKLSRTGNSSCVLLLVFGLGLLLDL